MAGEGKGESLKGGRPPNIPNGLYCCGCERNVDVKEFYPNYSEYCENRFDKMYYCKKCTKEISDKIFKKYSLYELACREMCSVFKLPYIDKAMIIMKDREFTTTSTKEKNIDRVYQYLLILKKEVEIPKEYWSNLSCNSFLHCDILHSARATSDGDNELFLDLEKTWGKKDKLDDYLWLEEKFSVYTEGETLTPSMINTIRYLCQAELDVVKLKEGKCDQEEIKKAEKRVMDYYKTLKLDDFKFNKEKSVAEKMLENWIYIEENYEPLDWEDENLKDRCGFKADNDDIMRSIGNKVLGTRNFPQLELNDIKKKK